MGALVLVKEFEGREIRTHIDDQGNPWWVAADVCAVLGLEQVSRAISRLDEDEKGVTISNTPGGRQELSTVSESGLYSLILTSRKPDAKRFKKWVTAEVLPSIRKTGRYAQGSRKAPTILDQMEANIRLWREQEERNEEVSLTLVNHETRIGIVEARKRPLSAEEKDSIVNAMNCRARQLVNDYETQRKYIIWIQGALKKQLFSYSVLTWKDANGEDFDRMMKFISYWHPDGYGQLRGIDRVEANHKPDKATLLREWQNKNKA